LTVNAALFSSNYQAWETPDEFFESAHAEFGFDVDVCAEASNAKLMRYFSPDDDGLSQPWAPLTCWMNPPYGREIKAWMRKAFEESIRGATVVCLVPARTDTSWWHEYAALAEVRYLRGRLRFKGAKAGAPFPSALVILRPREFRRNNEAELSEGIRLAGHLNLLTAFDGWTRSPEPS
jgi:phage N-6-adenine-methyltransferase